MSTAKLVVAAGPGKGGTEDGGTQPQPAGTTHTWEPLSAQAGQAELEVVSGSGWAFVRAELGTNMRGSVLR